MNAMSINSAGGLDLEQLAVSMGATVARVNRTMAVFPGGGVGPGVCLDDLQGKTDIMCLQTLVAACTGKGTTVTR